ncbi:tRNA pseudouridine13 synthase [Planctomicrobium piriforme]|uniref:tRNA pseudouridine13 synthase n=2 Tax=Planctomicrobium piriforme TaxID=1576369 RepID=A0A1I3NHR2_9PLAN|nr:tRNA pseudouridine13 synthase [Planctomicrobium piriforme]
MKLRRQMEDFRVTEQSSLQVGSAGPFAVYDLKKVGWTTLDAIDRLARQLDLPRRNINHAGLKDRYAVTSQRVTIRNGPRRSYDDGPLSLTYLGQSTREISSDDIASNQFTIVLRSLTPEEHQLAAQALPEIQQSGVPNYFDDQRFGSWFPEHGFIAAAWIRDRYEEAFRLAFAEFEPTDNADERQQKAILRELWGDWIQCKQLLDRSHRRSIVTYLCDHPADFKGAWALVNPDLRGLYLSALQSHLWNQIVSEMFVRHCNPDQLVNMTLKPGPVAAPRRLTEEQREFFLNASCPLPSARLRLEDFAEPELVAEVLAKQGWTLPELKVRFPRDKFFSRAQRPVMIPVKDCSGEFADDDLDPGRTRLTLTFTLPRGAYATMVVKRLTLGEPVADETPETAL